MAEQTALLDKSGAALDDLLLQKCAKLQQEQTLLAERQGILASVRPSTILEREKLKLQRARLS